MQFNDRWSNNNNNKKNFMEIDLLLTASILKIKTLQMSKKRNNIFIPSKHVSVNEKKLLLQFLIVESIWASLMAYPRLNAENSWVSALHHLYYVYFSLTVCELMKICLFYRARHVCAHTMCTRTNETKGFCNRRIEYATENEKFPIRTY